MISGLSAKGDRRVGNNMVQEAVDAAAADMGKVETAADAISKAIGKVTPLLDGQTWTGAAATSWEGDWKSFYKTVTNCLNDLPAAEKAIISDVQTKMEHEAAKMARQQAQHPAA